MHGNQVGLNLAIVKYTVTFPVDVYHTLSTAQSSLIHFATSAGFSLCVGS